MRDARTVGGVAHGQPRIGLRGSIVVAAHGRRVVTGGARVDVPAARAARVETSDEAADAQQPRRGKVVDRKRAAERVGHEGRPGIRPDGRDGQLRADERGPDDSAAGARLRRGGTVMHHHCAAGDGVASVQRKVGDGDVDGSDAVRIGRVREPCPRVGRH
jgi:hypothetical protein